VSISCYPAYVQTFRRACPLPGSPLSIQRAKQKTPNFYTHTHTLIQITQEKRYDHDECEQIPNSFFFFLVCEAIGTAATPGLLYQPRMIVNMIVEKQISRWNIDWRGNRSSRRKPAPAPLLFITQSHMPRPGFEPGPLRWEAGFRTFNSLSLFLLFRR
jgi:hypothetical protein